MSDKLVYANVVDLRTNERDFYAYANSDDAGFDPMLSFQRVGSTVFLLATSNFKTKIIREKLANQLDIYMKPEAAMALCENMEAEIGVGAATEFNGDPNKGRKGKMQLPDIMKQSYRSGVYSCFADVAGRHFSYMDEAGLTSLYIDWESPKRGHIVMEDLEVHIGCRMYYPPKRKELEGRIHYFSSSIFSKDLHKDLKEPKYPEVFGSAPGLIVLTMLDSQAKTLAAGIRKLSSG